jgi:hypothetical protein
MGTNCITCKNKECVNHNKSVYFSWDCKKYFNNGYTNADHIRQLSDKDLANFLTTKLPCAACDCTDLMLEWLRSPTTESNIK